jgi:hypothetical protein
LYNNLVRLGIQNTISSVICKPVSSNLHLLSEQIPTGNTILKRQTNEMLLAYKTSAVDSKGEGSHIRLIVRASGYRCSLLVN